MSARKKRAATARVFSKASKPVVADASSEHNDNRIRNQNAAVKKKKKKRIPRLDGGDPQNGSAVSSFAFEFDSTACIQPVKRRMTVAQKKRKSDGSCHRRSQNSPLPPREGGGSRNDIGLFSGSSLSTTSVWINGKQIEVELSTGEKDHMEHQRRRSLRLVNSTGPMLLSYRTSFRIENCTSPIYSPVASCRLKFTPVAHIPTTPVVSYGSEGTPM